MAERVFYACQAISVDALGSSSHTTSPKYLAGIQSASLTSNSEYIQLNQFGMIDVLQNLENVTNIECTIEASLLNNRTSLFDIFGGYDRSSRNLYFSVYKDVYDTSASIIPYIEAENSSPTTLFVNRPYITSFSVDVPLDGFVSESVTLSSNHLYYVDSVDLGAGNAAGITTRYFQGSGFLRSDAYLLVSGFRSPWVAGSPNVWETGVYKDKLQSVSISLDIGREDLFKLGQKSPYYKAAQFPIETTIEYTIANEWGGNIIDPIYNGTNSGIYNKYGFELQLFGNKSPTAAAINYKIYDAVLTSQAKSGGDTGGGVSTITYSFSSYSLIDISYPAANPTYPANV